MKSAIVVVVYALLAAPAAAFAGDKQVLEQLARVQTEIVTDTLEQQLDEMLERELKEPPGPGIDDRAHPQPQQQESPAVAGLFLAEL